MGADAWIGKGLSRHQPSCRVALAVDDAVPSLVLKGGSNMDVELELRIHERRDDRVVVALRVVPTGDVPVTVDGAALHVVDAAGDEVCPQVLLPVSGALSGPVDLTVELRATRSLPVGCRVVGLAWSGCDQSTSSCPADPDVSLFEFLRGARHRIPAEDAVELFTLDDEQRVRLEATWPWLVRPIRAADDQAFLEAGTLDDDVDALAEDLGLDDDSAEWLHDLLHEADP